jgi:hypothetical protein
MTYKVAAVVLPDPKSTSFQTKHKQADIYVLY